MAALNLKALDQLIDGLGTREKILGALAVVAAGYLLLDRAVLTGFTEQRATTETELTATQARIDALKQRLTSEASGASLESDLAAKRAEREGLLAQVAATTAIERNLRERPLSAAALMRRALQTPNPRVIVESVKVLPAETLQVGGTAQLYRHGVELQVRGSYADLLAYLEGLERDERIFWSGLRLSTASYPELTLNVSLYALNDSARSLGS